MLRRPRLSSLLALCCGGCVPVVDTGAAPLLDRPPPPADRSRPVAGCTATARWFLEEDGLVGEEDPGRGLSSVTVDRFDTQQRLFARSLDGVRAPWPAYEGDRAPLATWTFEGAPAWPAEPTEAHQRQRRWCDRVEPDLGADLAERTAGTLGDCFAQAAWTLEELAEGGALRRRDTWTGGPEPRGSVHRTLWDADDRLRVEGDDRDADGVIDEGVEWAWTVRTEELERLDAGFATDLREGVTVLWERERRTALDGSTRLERLWSGPRDHAVEEVWEVFEDGLPVVEEHSTDGETTWVVHRTWEEGRLVLQDTEHRDGQGRMHLEREERVRGGRGAEIWRRGTRAPGEAIVWTEEVHTRPVDASPQAEPTWALPAPSVDLRGRYEVRDVDPEGTVRAVVRAQVAPGGPVEATEAWLPQHDDWDRRVGTVYWVRERQGGGWLEGWLAVEEVQWACPAQLPPR
ncbi:MAG: hypothetical protein H6732_15185 [Alphaproteobacteria bacterium]|nr:hypothetical protein [Alphaproteobacteria bacterium]